MVRLIGTILHCQFTGSSQGSKVYRLKDLLIQFLSILTVKRIPHQDEGIGQPLDSDTDRTMTFVGPLGLRNRIVVDVDDSVEVTCHHLHRRRKCVCVCEFNGGGNRYLGNFKQVCKVKGQLSSDKSWQSNGGKVTDSNL